MTLWILRKGTARAIVRAEDEPAAQAMAAKRDIRRDKNEFWASARVTELSAEGHATVIMMR